MSNRNKNGAVQIVESARLRRALSEILDSLDTTDARFVVTVEGEPRAVLVGIRDYLRKIRAEKRDELLASIQRDAKQAASDRLTARQINREIQATRRHKQPGRVQRRS